MSDAGPLPEAVPAAGSAAGSGAGSAAGSAAGSGAAPGDALGTAPARAVRWRALAPLRNRDYRLLIGATGLSMFGNGMWAVVMVFQVMAIDDRPTALSAVAACLSGGLLAFVLVGGVVADRVPKRSVIITVQAVNLLAVAAVSALAFADAIRLWHMAVAAALLGAGSAFFFPAYSAYLPAILRPDELLAANGLEGALRPTLQQALGPALGGMVVGALVPAAGAAATAALHAGALALLLFLRPEPRAEHAGEAGGERPGALADMREGFVFTLRTPWLLWTLLFACLMLLVVMGPIEVLLPFIARERFADGERMFGLLLTAFGAGGAVGSLVVSSWRLPRRYLTVMVIGWGAGNLPLVVIGHVTSFWVMAAGMFLIGFSNGAGMVIWGTLLQRRVPPAMLGRVSSLDFFVSIALMPLSIAVAGPLSTVVPTPVIFTAAGVVPPVLAVAAVLAGRMAADEIAHPLDPPAA
ncbi:tetracycline efflux MFS transporter Tet(V) [Planomonospora alba]|uniref:Tetracycline efflux MFS transporter Tet(V) n=1 Tax=Planomonospora alba TaxID=161354 RepID=A0ABP6P2L6_9ACTN